MEVLVLTNHEAVGRKYRKLDLTTKLFSSEYKTDVISFNGVYFEEVQGEFMAIFSNEGKNYLHLKNKLIELTKDISIQYFCGEGHEKSWIKLFEKDELFFDIEYVNPTQEPYIDFVSGFEDWEVVNFAWHFAGYINRVRENPEVILFPGV